MIERRALERIAINQPALLCVDGIRGCHPCLVVNLHREGATKRQSIAVWCGGTEIPAASNLSIKATLSQRTARHEPRAWIGAMQQYRLTLRCC